MPICAICNKEMKIINNFHLDTHNISVKEYERRFPGSGRYSEDSLARMAEANRVNNLGKKRPQWMKDKMSKVRKEKIANGEITTPFMTMDKTGDNNPAWGTKYHTIEEINKLKEKNSKIMSEKIINNELQSSYNNGKFISNKNDKVFHYRSSYEKNLFDILENMECVINYEYESVRIPYFYEGTEHHYIPDFLIYFDDDKKVLMEIGPKSFKLYPDAKTSKKYNSAIEFCSFSEMDFLIATEDSLNQLSDSENSVNCWNDLSTFCYNVIGNDKRECLKNENIKELISSQAPERS